MSERRERAGPHASFPLALSLCQLKGEERIRKDSTLWLLPSQLSPLQPLSGINT